MKRAAGQAGMFIFQVLHQLWLLCLTVFIALMLALGLLACRLSLGPLQIPYLAAELANAVSGTGVDIHVGRAELAWAGYHKGGGAPLYLQLGDVQASNAAHVNLASIPDARLVFLPSALLGSKAPILVNSADVHFNGSDVAVALQADIRLGLGFHLSQADLFVTLGAGKLGAGGVAVPITGGGFTAHVTPDDVALANGRLNLAASGNSAPVVLFSGHGKREKDWQGQLVLSADKVQAADLASYWPPALAALTQHWVTSNIIAGTGHDAKFTFTLAAPANLSSIKLTNVTGSFLGDDLTLDWLPGVRPITGLHGKLTFVDADDVLVTADTAQLGKINLQDGNMKISGVSKKDQIAVISVLAAGKVQDALTVLNAPPLNLLAQAPPQILEASGDVNAKITATLPLADKVEPAEVNLLVAAALTKVALPTPLSGLVFSDGVLNLQSSMTGLQVSGTVQLAGEAAVISARANYKNAQPLQSFDLKTLAGPQLLDKYGLDAGTDMNDAVSGAVPLELHVKPGAKNQQIAVLTADLTPASLGLPVFGWAKTKGSAGSLNLSATLDEKGDFTALNSIDASATGLAIHGRVHGDVLALSEMMIGRTQAQGVITPPRAGKPWLVDLHGPVLDLRAILSPQKNAKPKPPQADTAPPAGFAWQARLDFNSLYLAADPAIGLQNFIFTGSGKGDNVLQADAQAADASGASGGAVNLTIRPVSADGAQRDFHLDAGNAGSLLRVLGAYDHLQNGALNIDGIFGAGDAMAGTLRMKKFRILQAPVIGKILQAITIYGVADATSGPGLEFERLDAPFSTAAHILTLKDARAYSSSLGFTVTGTIGLADGNADLDTTVIPYYALNALPGKIPLIGKLFSAEKGGGLISMRVKITGQLRDPEISVNPFSALTPGALRGVFGAGEKAAK